MNLLYFYLILLIHKIYYLLQNIYIYILISNRFDNFFYVFIDDLYLPQKKKKKKRIQVSQIAKTHNRIMQISLS